MGVGDTHVGRQFNPFYKKGWRYELPAPINRET